MQQAAPAAAVEPEMNCCGCIEIKCGLTTLMVLEIFYLIGFIVILATVVFIGGMASAVGSSASSEGYGQSEAVKQVNDIATAFLWSGILCIVAEIPRMYYLCKLCGFICCGGKVRDSLADRQGIVMAIKALVVNQILSALIVIVVTAAVGAPFSGGVVQVILSFVINCLFACWWIVDLQKWAALKSA